MTASTYFQRGPNGEPPMFGPEGFASDATPRGVLGNWLCLTGSKVLAFDTGVIGEPHKLADPVMAASSCAIAAQGWIRSKGYVLVVQPLGDLSVEKFGDDSKRRSFAPLNGSPDWHTAALWVYEKTKENKE